MHKLIMTLDRLSAVVAPRRPSRWQPTARTRLLRPFPGAAARCGERCATGCWSPAAGSTARSSARRCPWRRTSSARSSPPDDSPRRSIYLQVRRTKPVSFLTAFDAPVMTVNCDTPRGQHRRAAVADADEQRVRPEAGRRCWPRGCGTKRRLDFAPRTDRAARCQVYRARAEAWQFGYGAFDEASQRVRSFHAAAALDRLGLARRARRLPDPQIGWAILHAAGGHAGRRPDACRRFAAGPRRGRARCAIAGKLKHASENGDGVRGRIVSSRGGLARRVAGQERRSGDATSRRIEVEPGDTIDFVVDCRRRRELAIRSTGPSSSSSPSDRAGAARHLELRRPTFTARLGATLPQQVACAWQIAYQRPADQRRTGRSAARFVAGQLAQLRASGDSRRPRTGRADEPLSATPQLQRVSLCRLNPPADAAASSWPHSAFGIGAFALAHLLQQDGLLRRDGRPSRARTCRSNLHAAAAALRAEGEGDDLAVHARRAVATSICSIPSRS